MKKLLALFVHPVLWLAVAFVAAALLIWFVGPLVAIGRFHPFDSETVRWILIALLLAAFVGRRVWAWFKARRANAALMDGLVQGARAPPAAPSASEQEVAQLRERFEQAIAVLRQVRLSASGKRPGITDLLALTGRQYLYQLPWYVFIGAPGSGKTTALVNSGLQFPLAEKFGTGSIRGVGGTRNCDWWFTDEAVLLDTAGRYTTQESDREADSAAWGGFLQLLRKARPRRPINGVLLTMSVADLLQQSPQEREAHAQALRERLHELHGELQIRFPIYVLVTKCDLLAGFTEFFGEFSKEERAQVWGTTFPYDEDAAQPPHANLRAEIAALEARLLERVTDRMQAERDPVRRAAIFAFPQQFGSFAAVLNDFVAAVFSATKYDERPLLRGVYFTSGTQEGSPIDRVMGTLARAFGVERRLAPGQAAAGRSYFITRLLHDVIFHEQGLAGTNRKWERRRNLIKWGALATAGVLLAGAGIAWIVSHSRNDAYIADVAARTPEVRKIVEAVPVGGSTDILEVLPALRALQNLPRTEALAGGVPTSMGFGLFQGDKLAAAADYAYRRLLQDAVMPRVALRVEEQLHGANANNLEFAYEALKMYLMLHDPAHFDAQALGDWIGFDLDRSLPRDFTQEQRDEVQRHVQAMIERGAVSSPVPADPNLVRSVRTMLAQYPLANRVYSRLKRIGVGAEIGEFTVAKAGGAGAALVFTRASGLPLTKGVPGLFTYDGYYKGFRGDAEKVANQLADEDGWVLGMKDAGRLGRLTDVASREALANDVRRLYLNDYARIWEEFLKDVQLVRPASLQQSIEVARVLSAPDNPLVPFLRAAARETTLLKQDADKNVVDKATEGVKETRRQLSSIFGGDVRAAPAAAPADRIEMIVDARFEKLRRFVTAPAPGQPAPVDGALALVGELHTMLTAADTALKAKAAPPPSEVPNKVKAQAPGMPEPLGTMLQTLSESSARHAGGAIVANTTEAIGAQVGDFCRQAVAGRYPLVRSSGRDATQDDFANLFAPGGKMDEFFQKNLAPLVDTSTKPWSYKRINDVAIGGSGALIQFQRAATIRDVFFRSGGRTPGLKLDFKPVEMDAAITQFILDVDGQLVKYAHGPQVPQSVQWPGPRGSTQVRVQIQPPGASGVSGMSTEGPWALFRMFDKVDIVPSRDPERFRVIFTVDGRKAEFEVVASSVLNPFRLPELSQFQCP